MNLKLKLPNTYCTFHKQWLEVSKQDNSFSVIDNHKGEIIERKVEEVLREQGVRNVFTLIIDNASSNDVVVTY